MLVIRTIKSYFLGKYKLEERIKSKLIQEEKYIDGTEIINYDEQLIIIIILTALLSIILSFFSLWFAIIAVVSILLSTFSLSIDIVYLSSERLIVEHIGVTEKLFRIDNEVSLSLDQVAIVRYSRAPPMYPGLIISSVLMIVIGILSYAFSWFILLLLPPFIYMFGYSLRLTRRSLELSVIGVSRNVGIGRDKGISIEFVRKVQEMIFERIHHFSHDDKLEHKIKEFPLQYSSKLKNLLKQVHSPIEQFVIENLDNGNKSTLELIALSEEDPHMLRGSINCLEERNIIKREEDKWLLI